MEVIRLLLLLLFLDEAVGGCVGEHDLRLELEAFFGGDDSVCHNDDDITHLDLARCCTIQTDGATAALTCDGVGVKSLTVIHVNNIHALALDDASGIHEVLVDGDAANVVEVGIGDRHTVYLGFHDLDVHSLYDFLVNY